MIKLHIPNDSKMSVGGGWTFIRNLKNATKTIKKLVLVDNPNEADIFLIAGATTITRKTFKKLKDTGKSIVLRVDGIPEDWRNRGTGWSRLKDFFNASDAVIYQSIFIALTTGAWLESVTEEKRSVVIYNGVDKSIFKPEGDKHEKFGNPSWLHVNSRKDENKRIEEVIARYRFQKTKNKNLTLTLVGKYPTYLKDWNFGLYDYKQGKDWQYLGIIKDRQELAKIMRSADKFCFPSFADPCPNVLLEALHCGADIIMPSGFGSTEELIKIYSKGHNLSIELMTKSYYQFLKKILKQS